VFFTVILLGLSTIITMNTEEEEELQNIITTLWFIWKANARFNNKKIVCFTGTSFNSSGDNYIHI